ncbi:MAG: GntR family transcriptional regulator [Bacillota bacterium]
METSQKRAAPAKEQVYRELKAAILSLELKPGQAIVESVVGELYGISRTPAREALSRLVDEGLVEVVPRKGYFVAPVTLQDVLESYHLRILMEPEAAALAAERGDPRVVEALRQNMEQHMQKATVELNREFHLLIAQASGNQRLARLISQLLDDVERVALLDPYMLTPDGSGHDEHLVIIEAIQRRDAEAARACMKGHLEQGRDRALALLQQGGQATIRFR